ncbi:MAG: ATP-binding protein [Erysipelothrix sp.]|nr:ATP-binding protein [Erysipelothrix sp.]
METLTVDDNTLSNILSSGTRRALNMMVFVKTTLLSGGMLYIDEIETNLNNAIIIDLLKLFYSKQTNPFGAILVFSSHYSELLDYIKRNDSIYVLVKGDNYQLNKLVNFSDVTKRNDLKKSEAYISNSLSVTSAPQTELQRSVVKSIINEIRNRRDN